MTGKQKFLTNSCEVIDFNNIHQNGFEDPPQYSVAHISINLPHCISCTCAQYPANAEVVRVQATNDDNLQSNTPYEHIGPKDLNFKENTIVFYDNNLIERREEIIDIFQDNNGNDKKIETQTIYHESVLKDGLNHICDEELLKSFSRENNLNEAKMNQTI